MILSPFLLSGLPTQRGGAGRGHGAGGPCLCSCLHVINASSQDSGLPPGERAAKSQLFPASPSAGSMERFWVCISALTHTHTSPGRASGQGDSPFLTVSEWQGRLWGFSETVACCCLQLGASCHPFPVLYFSFSGFSLSSLLLAGVSLSFLSWA